MKSDRETYLVERAFVPVLLQELLLPLGFFFSALLRVFEVLLQPLLLRQCSSSLDLFTLEFARESSFFVALDTGKLA